ncbi:hypothetical protein N752_05685 [Desulforamulus aquiferis]|nr:sigma-70 family RNA polymerase sigma factor [Desulforamulus aquiferis]RYD06139.1 hypothetical protein N752_05685 [Desulforamulus aquiferis]
MSIIKRLFSRQKNIDKTYSELIFELYYKSAYQTAYFYCGDATISEEASQEAIFKAIQYIEQLRDPDKVEAWIKRITINCVNNIISKNKKIVSIEYASSIIDTLDNTPEYIIDSQETKEIINKAINNLDPVMKQVIFLYYFREMKVKDIAILTNKPEGTIKTLLHRARNNIKNSLLKEGYINDRPKGGLKFE